METPPTNDNSDTSLLVMDTAITPCCILCGKAAPYRCPRCTEGLGPDFHTPATTHYCSKACQTEHWSQHNRECKASNERKVIRLGSKLVSAAFLFVRLIALDEPIEKAVVDGKGVIIEQPFYHSR